MKNKSCGKLLALLLTCVALLAAFGCGPREAGRKKLAADSKGAFATMVDANGREVILVKKPERISQAVILSTL